MTNTSRNIAFAHCRLLPGGAAEVLDMLIESETKDIDSIRIFTLVSRESTWSVNDRIIAVSSPLPRWVQSIFFFFQDNRVPVLSFLFDYRNLFVVYPLLVWMMRQQVIRRKADQVVISSFAIAKNIVPSHGWSIPTILYIHSPMQYIHTHYQEYILKLRGMKQWIFKHITHYIRVRDTKARSYDTIIANSKYTDTSIQKIYNLTADRILYPPLAGSHNNEYPLYTHLEKKNYFIYVGRLVRLVKEVDRLIHLCNATGDNLIIVGSGPEEGYLQQIAGPTITFTGWINDTTELLKMIAQSRGMLNITKESFGIVTVQSLLQGIPVFGYNDGATPELIDKQSGILVTTKDHQTLIDSFQIFKETKWNSVHIRTHIREVLSQVND